MGVRFSIHLYFPLSKLECAIEEIVNLSEPPTNRRISILLPDDTKIVVPDASGGRIADKEIYLLKSGGDSVYFDTMLLLLLDEYIETHLSRVRTKPPEIFDRNKKYAVGLFDFELQAGKSFAEIAVYPVSSSQNEIMLKSSIMHQTMKDILSECEGLFGLIDTETSDGTYQQRLLLTDVEKQISLDLIKSNHGNDIDFVVGEIKRQINMD